MDDVKPEDDEMVAKIDAATAGYDDDTVETLEQRLRLLIPGHSYWEREKVQPELPGPVAAMLGKLNIDPDDVKFVGDDGGAPEMVSVSWSTPEGFWVVQFAPCVGHEETDDSQVSTWHVVVQGPGTKLSRDHLSIGQTVDLLRLVGAISG